MKICDQYSQFTVLRVPIFMFISNNYINISGSIQFTNLNTMYNDRKHYIFLIEKEVKCFLSLTISDNLKQFVE